MNNYSPIVLAYLGDAVYEQYIREHLIKKGICKVNELQKQSIKYVSAKGQVVFLNYLLDNKKLTDEEVTIVLKGRNYKREMHPKNTDVITYKYSTGFEALIGYLYLNDKDRLDEILLMIGMM